MRASASQFNTVALVATEQSQVFGGVAKVDSVNAASSHDDLSRDVYGILGIPVDAVDLCGVLQRIEEASRAKTPFLISTPNLNFLVSSQEDVNFRDSLLASDLCPADGVPIIWVARMLGVPIKRRVAGSDIFEALKSGQNLGRPMKVFLFGGPPGVAQSASDALNAKANGVVCVGSLYPGYRSVVEMSSDDMIRTINLSGADFLILSLGAKKGQSWLLHNRGRLQVPVRSHFGAAINFQAGTLSRAPPSVRYFGFEWLWRIKEEPHLCRRYLHDGVVLLKLMLTCVTPLAVDAYRRRFFGYRDAGLNMHVAVDDGSTTIRLSGAAVAANVGQAIQIFRKAIGGNNDLRIEISGVQALDARFFGFFLMVRKQLMKQGSRLYFLGATGRNKRAFRLHGFDFLLNEP